MAKSKIPEEKKGKPIKVSYNYSKWYPVILIAMVFLIYARTISYQYVKMDDTDLIVENESFIKHTKNIPQAFRQSCFQIPGHLTENKSYYRPLLIVSFIADAQLHGARASRVFHFMNILYHIFACILLYGFIRKLSGNSLTAFVLSLLFAIHPVNAQAIAWIPGRNDVLLAIFALLSLHGLLDYYKNGKTGSLVLHLLAFGAALFTKESGVLLIPLYGIFMWLWLRDPGFYKRKYFIIAGYILLTAAWYFAMKSALKGAPIVAGNISLIQVFMKNLTYLFLYIGKLLLPFNLNVMPGADSIAYIYGSISFIIIIYLFYRIQDRRKALFSLAWYALFLAPTLLVPELPAYEHRDYLPLAGLLIGISQADILKEFTFRSAITLRIFGILILVFFITTFLRVPVFASRYAFWMDGTEGTPFAPSACVNVGELYQDEYNSNPNLSVADRNKMLQDAGKWNKTAIDMDSVTLRGNNNYGAFLYLSGHPDDAVPYFLKEIKNHPTNSDPYKNMGIYYKDKGQPEKSVTYWEKLIKLNRFYLTAYEELANYYQKTGDIAKAAMYRDELKTISEEAGK